MDDEVIGGRMPRTLLKLLVFCRVSGAETCELLLTMGRVKVNGEVVKDPVMEVNGKRVFDQIRRQQETYPCAFLGQTEYRLSICR